MLCKISIFWNRNITATFFLVLGLACCLLIASQYINAVAEKEEFENLEQNTAQFAKEIYNHILRDRGQLEIIAFIIGRHADVHGPEVVDILANFQPGGMIAYLEMLLPDDTVLMPDGRRMDAKDKLSFTKEIREGVHISDRETSLLDKHAMVVRHAVPVIKDGQAVGMLIGVVPLETLPKMFDAYTLGGSAQFYVIDGKSGDLIVDTWHKTLDNARMLSSRTFKPGYSVDKVHADLAAGHKGNFAFVSKTIGQYFYACYVPVGVNRWMAMLSIPEDVVFKNANKTRIALFLLGISTVTLLGIYFIWMLIKAKNEYYEKEKQLNQVKYMYDVEKLLFDAHMKQDNIGKVLHIIADMMTSEKSFFFTMECDLIKHAHIWDQGNYAEEDFLQKIPVKGWFPCLSRPLYEKTSVLLQHMGVCCRDCGAEERMLRRWGIRNLMLTPVKDIDDALIGILGVANFRYPWRTAEQLENVSLSFSMAMNNIKSYSTIKEMGMLDYLTELLNRNSFQNTLAAYEKNRCIPEACIYIDVNGLHELNNQFGHTAGDEMLQYVAAVLKKEFSENDTYRIGGDEFVIFLENEEKQHVLQKIGNLERAVQKKNYHLSIGLEWRHAGGGVHDMVKEAECRMYEAKRRYYQTKGERREARAGQSS